MLLVERIDAPLLSREYFLPFKASFSSKKGGTQMALNSDTPNCYFATFTIKDEKIKVRKLVYMVAQSDHEFKPQWSTD